MDLRSQTSVFYNRDARGEKKIWRLNIISCYNNLRNIHIIISGKCDAYILHVIIIRIRIIHTYVYHCSVIYYCSKYLRHTQTRFQTVLFLV